VKRAREAAKSIVEEGARPEDVGGSCGARPTKDPADGGTQVEI